MNGWSTGGCGTLRMPWRNCIRQNSTYVVLAATAEKADLACGTLVLGHAGEVNGFVRLWAHCQATAAVIAHERRGAVGVDRADCVSSSTFPRKTWKCA